MNAVFPALWPCAILSGIWCLIRSIMRWTNYCGIVPAEGAGGLCNFQVSLRPRTDAPAPEDAVRAEVLAFNSGGSGARPALDGMNATAFPSGVMTMPVEATENVGPVIIWRKELRPDSGGAGQYRGGLGQFMDVGPREGHECDISAMFDRVDHPALGRRGGGLARPPLSGAMAKYCAAKADSFCRMAQSHRWPFGRRRLWQTRRQSQG